MATDIIKQQVIKLAERYMQLAVENKLKSAKELSRLTYKLRESGEDILYLAVGTTNVNYHPVPILKQKNWNWYYKQEFGIGYIGFWVEIIPDGFEIHVYELGEKDGGTNKYQRITLYKEKYLNKS